MNKQRELVDTPEVRGMINKIPHLVRVVGALLEDVADLDLLGIGRQPFLAGGDFLQRVAVGQVRDREVRATIGRLGNPTGCLELPNPVAGLGRALAG